MRMKKNKFIKTLLSIFFIGVLNLFSYSQTSDPLYKAFKNTKNPDSLRFKAIDDFIWNNYMFENPDSAIFYANISYSFVVKIKNIRCQGVALNTKGTCYYLKDDFKNAILFYSQSLQKYKQVKDISGIASIHNNLGNIYKEQGLLVKAIESYNSSLKIAEKLKDQPGIASSLNNIGILYAEQDKYQTAKTYYLKSISIRKKMGEEGREDLSKPINNIGSVLQDEKDYFGAIKYYGMSQKLDKEFGNIIGEVTSIGNIAGIYKELGNRELKINKKLAEYYYQKSFDLSEEVLSKSKDLGDNTVIVTTYLNLAQLYDIRGESKKSLEFGQKAYRLAVKIGAITYVRDACEVLYRTHKKNGEDKLSLEKFEEFVKLNDSILSIENKDGIIHQSYQYKYDQQFAKDSVLQVRERQVVAAHFNQERTQRIALYGGMFLVLVFSIFIYKRYKVTFSQKELISLKEQETSRQKALLEVKNKEIMDSITYAKRIQSAILPPAKIVKEYLKESFVLYKPRDIVAGDFYWMEQIQDGIIFAAADCTGHGVPGAMVSVVCNNALNRTVREYGLTVPGEILDKARELIISEFDQTDDDMKDGMDISLCTMEFEPSIIFFDSSERTGVTLKWAGANNPLWILRDNQIIEYKANKQPIGVYFDPFPFTTHEIELKKNDIIYIFTDGFQDQFGGNQREEGKKFKVSRMKELFLSIADKQMSEQKELLDLAFETWKRDLEQVDDVCVIGVKI